MRFLTLFTADDLTPPTPEQMERMGKFVEQQAREGRLILTGGLKQRDEAGLRVRRTGDRYTVKQGGASWAKASGFAILEAPSRDALLEDVKAFLGSAGDGVSEIIEVSVPPPR